ncbi:MAG: porin family protein [Ignavibacteria bacterium]|nr:porin family protein [Ignavibacteria bacterium]
MFKKLFVIVLLAVSVSGLTFAQSIAIGPQAAYIKTSDAEKGVIMPAGAIRLNLGGLGIEGSVGYKVEEFFDGLIETTSYPIMVTALLKILPFIHAEAGLGWYNTKITYKGALSAIPSSTQKEVGYHAGAGAEIELGNLLLTADLRYVKMGELKDLKNVSNLKSDFIAIVGGVMFRL